MKSLETLRKAIESYDKSRERVIQAARKVIQTSKTAIYAIQRDDMAEGEKALQKLRTDFAELKEIVKKDPKLAHEGMFKVAVQEYVEALGLYEFVKKKDILSYSDEFVEHENYLMGLCDLCGELVRKAINSSIKENYKMAEQIRKSMEELYTELSKFDLRNGELRRKYDGIKYDLKKLDDVVFELKMKGKI